MIYLISSPEGEDTNFIGLQREDGKAPNIVQGGPEPFHLPASATDCWDHMCTTMSGISSLNYLEVHSKVLHRQQNLKMFFR